MLRLLRCRFWKSGPVARRRPAPRRSPAASGVSILMTLAPQSASWRTQVGPGAHARQVEHGEAGKGLGGPGKRHLGRLRQYDFRPDSDGGADIPRSIRALSIGPTAARPGSFIHHFAPRFARTRLEKNTGACHMTGADERPGLRVCGLRARTSSIRISPRPSDFSNTDDNPGNAGCLEPRDSAARISAGGRLAI